MEDPADSDLQMQKIVNQNDTDLVGIQNFLCFLCKCVSGKHPFCWVLP